MKWDFNIVTLISHRLFVLLNKFQVFVIFLTKLSSFIIEYFFIFHLFDDGWRLIELANDALIRWAISPIHLLVDGLIVLNSTCIFILPILRSNHTNLFRNQIYLRYTLSIHSIFYFLALHTLNTIGHCIKWGKRNANLFSHRINVQAVLSVKHFWHGLNKFFIFNNWTI